VAAAVVHKVKIVVRAIVALARIVRIATTRFKSRWAKTRPIRGVEETGRA
jgi:hypothetical protein